MILITLMQLQLLQASKFIIITYNIEKIFKF